MLSINVVTDSDFDDFLNNLGQFEVVRTFFDPWSFPNWELLPAEMLKEACPEIYTEQKAIYHQSLRQREQIKSPGWELVQTTPGN